MASDQTAQFADFFGAEMGTWLPSKLGLTASRDAAK
jgi:hypothetical protein